MPWNHKYSDFYLYTSTMEKVDSGNKYSIDNSLFNNLAKPKDTNVFVILLNQKFHGDSTTKLIAMSDYFICADGGANRLYDYLPERAERIKFKPQKIVGDLDSLKQVTREFYEAVGVDMDYRSSQDDSDTEKALESLKQIYNENDVWQKKKDNLIYIIGCFGTRMDHTLNNLSILHKYSKSSMAYCILPGYTKFIRGSLFESDKGIGLIPLCGVCEYVTTKGFKWDLGGELTRLEFGSFVSSSNEFVSTEEVQITTSAPLVLTIPFRVKSLKKRKEDC